MSRHLMRCDGLCGDAMRCHGGELLYVSSFPVGWNVMSFARPCCVVRGGSVTMW